DGTGAAVADQPSGGGALTHCGCGGGPPPADVARAGAPTTKAPSAAAAAADQTAARARPRIPGLVAITPGSPRIAHFLPGRGRPRTLRRVIPAVHAIVYAEDPDAARAFFRDVLQWPNVDAHGGWLIFRTGPSELG